VRKPASLRARREDGAAAVEFALVVPFLLMLVFGIVSYGYMLSFRQALSQGAAEGVRAAAVSTRDSTEEQTRTAALAALNEALQTYGVSCDGAAMSFRGATAGTCSVRIDTCVNNAAKRCATVDLDYAYRENAPIPTFPGVGVVLPASLGYAAVAEVG
jgi:Flp pilus assembly protein TadG